MNLGADLLLAILLYGGIGVNVEKAQEVTPTMRKTQSRRVLKRGEKASESPKKENLKMARNYKNLMKDYGIKPPELSQTRLFLGLDINYNMVDVKHLCNDCGSSPGKMSAIDTAKTAGLGFRGGIVNMDKWVGGRFGGELAYMKIPKFHIITLGLHLDFLINFYTTNSWSVGTFVATGGGMYMALFDDENLESSGKVPFSPIGWVSGGLRFNHLRHNVELAYRYGYIFANVYSNSYQNAPIASSATEKYALRASNIIFSYILTF